MALASFIYRRYLSSTGAQRKMWATARRALIRLQGDPPCEMAVHGRSLRLPLSHALPDYLSQFPLYDRLPQRISAFVHRRQGRLSCIDVGANIGDTAAAFYREEADTFLAVEPNPRFHRFLAENWSWNKNVTLLSDVCSSGSDEGTFAIREKHGTASLVQTQDGILMRERPLDEIVKDHPAAAAANVLKVDTDGHDFKILEGAKGLLARNRPAVLFECDSASNPRYVEECLGALGLLKACGYDHFLLYDNFGYLMGRYPLAEPGAFRSLLFYQLTSACYYYDILVMGEEELTPFYEEEVAFFAGRMAEPALRPTALAAAKGS